MLDGFWGGGHVPQTLFSGGTSHPQCLSALLLVFQVFSGHVGHRQHGPQTHRAVICSISKFRLCTTSFRTQRNRLNSPGSTHLFCQNVKKYFKHAFPDKNGLSIFTPRVPFCAHLVTLSAGLFIFLLLQISSPNLSDNKSKISR